MCAVRIAGAQFASGYFTNSLGGINDQNNPIVVSANQTVSSLVTMLDTCNNQLLSKYPSQVLISYAASQWTPLSPVCSSGACSFTPTTVRICLTVLAFYSDRVGEHWYPILFCTEWAADFPERCSVFLSDNQSRTLSSSRQFVLHYHKCSCDR